MTPNTGKHAAVEWLAEQLRFTGFPSPDSDFRQQAWWAEVSGDEPEKRESEPKVGRSRDLGTVDGRLLTLAVQPSRIDWLSEPLIADVMGEHDPPHLPEVQRVEESVPPFVEHLHRWFGLDSIPKLKRIAFGAILGLPVESRIAGYDVLDRWLPFKVDGTTSQNMVYQINRPRASALVEGLQVNRVANWSVQERQAVHWTISADGADQQLGTSVAECRLTLDMNTRPEYKGDDFVGEVLPKLLDELVSFALEIADRGDVA